MGALHSLLGALIRFHFRSLLTQQVILRLKSGKMPFQGGFFILRNVKKLTVAQVIERRNANHNLLLLDVRIAEGWEEHRIPGSLHIPMHSIVSRISELDAERKAIVLCEHGVRSEKCSELPRYADEFSGYFHHAGRFERMDRTDGV